MLKRLSNLFSRKARKTRTVTVAVSAIERYTDGCIVRYDDGSVMKTKYIEDASGAIIGMVYTITYKDKVYFN